MYILYYESFVFQFPSASRPQTLPKRYHGTLSSAYIDFMEVREMFYAVVTRVTVERVKCPLFHFRLLGPIGTRLIQNIRK